MEGPTLLCSCGGILVVKNVEEIPENLSKKEKLLYNRLCDVECLVCGKVLYSQPYDFGKNYNITKKY